MYLISRLCEIPVCHFLKSKCLSLSLSFSLPEPTEVPTEGAEQESLALGSFQNHTGPVHSLQVYGGRLYTCSGDGTARAYCLVVRPQHRLPAVTCLEHGKLLPSFQVAFAAGNPD